jgi:hypothetical protein
MKLAGILPLAAVLLLAGCGRHESTSQRRDEANTPAGKVGQAAHTVAKGTGKVLKEAGKEIGKAAHQAKEGWNEAAREDKAKNRK